MQTTTVIEVGSHSVTVVCKAGYFPEHDLLGYNQAELAYYQFNAGFLLSLFFYPEDGGDMLLLNVD
jgi:hypothetical protein